MRWIFMMMAWTFGPAVSMAAPTLALPEVSGPGIPFVHFGGMAPAESSTVVTTVPENKELILTLAAADPGLSLQIDGTTLVPEWLTEAGPNNAMAKGTAHVPVGPGQTLTIYNDRGSEIGYYIQGYLAEPGSPYRSFYGESWSTGESRTLMTADALPFMVQTLAVRDNCDVLIDGVLTIPESSKAVFIGYTNRGMLNGKGTLVVPAGASLQVDRSCEYFVNGKYLTP